MAVSHKCRRSIAEGHGIKNGSSAPHFLVPSAWNFDILRRAGVLVRKHAVLNVEKDLALIEGTGATGSVQFIRPDKLPLSRGGRYFLPNKSRILGRVLFD